MNGDLLFGICADVHHEENHDNCWRMQKFVDEAKARKADFIIQLGDFTAPNEMGRQLLEVWNQFEGPRYHVLGNHDNVYLGKKPMMDFLGMSNSYYSFDMGDYHFVILDTNYAKIDDRYIDYDGNIKDFFNCYISQEQLDWLAADLDATDKRCFLFTHATLLQGQWTIYNTHQFEDLIYRVNQKAGFNKVTMCFSGHDHADEYLFKGGVHYVLINSMSHRYIGPLYTEHASSAGAVEKDYGKLNYVVPYKDPLYAFVRLKKNGFVQIIGKQSEYVGHSPLELHWPHSCAPQISYREMWMNGIGEL